MTPWQDIEFDYPPIPTMITPEERQYLYWLGAQEWQGLGHVVEIGPWLGGSTACLAAGMKSRERNTCFNLHVFDNFMWRGFMADRVALPLAPGESFQPYFESNVAKYKDLVTVHRQALPDEEIKEDWLAVSNRANQDENIPVLHWDLQEPVEILFIDGAKSWTGLRNLLQVFSTQLIPGTSLFVCQDYKYWGTYWVPIIFEYLMRNLVLHHNIVNNTVTFRLVAEIPPQALEEMGELVEFDLHRGLELLDAASRRLVGLNDPLGALILQSCKVRFLWHKGEMESAMVQFRRLESEWPIGLDGSTIDLMRNWLSHCLGRPVPASLRWKLGLVPRTVTQTIGRLTKSRN